MHDQVVSLAGLRERLGVSQGRLAEQLGTTQAGVLKTERSGDPQMSTIRRYVEGLDHLVDHDVAVEIRLIVGDSTLLLEQPEDAGDDMPTTTTATRSWRLRAWDDRLLEQRWLTEGVIAMSQDEVGDMTAWRGDDGLRGELEASLEARGDPRGKQAIGTFVGYWRAFRLEMQRGDHVAVPLSGRRVGIGEITGDYEYRPEEPDPRMRHVRPVRWLCEMDRADLDAPLRKVVNAPGTICQIRNGDLGGVANDA